MLVARGQRPLTRPLTWQAQAEALTPTPSLTVVTSPSHANERAFTVPFVRVGTNDNCAPQLDGRVPEYK